ncbi:hypothetical protein [Nocardioides sp.]|uniref:hypothetical protein n=1 Tax=Nocardioides sp. TaxID=35761 RepID=UPI002B27133E|nr:hypothetical protein [Nocardioides sp.]
MRLGKTPDAVSDAYLAEVTDQANRCRVEPYNSALAEALVRRVSRNLAMRNLPLGVVLDDVGATRIGSNDPEVRRLEGHYRKAPIG